LPPRIQLPGNRSINITDIVGMSALLGIVLGVIMYVRYKNAKSIDGYNRFFHIQNSMKVLRLCEHLGNLQDIYYANLECLDRLNKFWKTSEI